MKSSCSNIKKFLIFSQKKAYISGNGNPEKISYISGTSYILENNFPSSKNEKNPL